MNLCKAAQLFSASVRTQSAATAVEDIVAGKKIDDAAREAMSRVGLLLLKTDWNQEQITEENLLSHELSAQATRTRPIFYASLRKLYSEIRKLGLNTSEELAEFLANMYRFLISGGRDEVAQRNHLVLFAAILQEISDGLLSKYRQHRISLDTPLVIR